MKILNTLLISLLAYSASAQVGIGTSTPTVPLDIEAADAAIDINNTSTDPLIHFQVSGTTNFTIGTDVTDSKFKIGTTALETGTAVTVQPTGEVGIGTSSPTATLDVDGSAIFNESGNSVDFRVEGLGESNLLFVDGSADMVGIGTSSPGALLDVAGSANMSGSTTETVKLEIGTGRSGDGNSYIDLVGDATYTNYGARFVRYGGANGATTLNSRGTGGFNINAVDAADITFLTTNTERVRIGSTGLVGIGTTTPTADLHVLNSLHGNMKIQGTGLNYSAYLDLQNTSRSSATGQNGGYFRIQSDGGSSYNGSLRFLKMSIDGTSVISEPLRIDENYVRTKNCIPQVDNTYDLGLSYRRWDDVYATNGTIQTSDRRLKTNIDTLNYGLAEVMQLTPVSFNWKSDTINEIKRNKIGYIAQEVLKIIPELVNIGDDENKTLGMNYAEMVVVLTKAIKEQQAIIESQKAENEAQKQEIETIKAEASSSSVETNQKLKETAQKLAALEAKLNALLLLNSKGAVLTAEN